MVTIEDVAKQANVSCSTVSKVINDYSSISDETKKKVNDAIKKLGYTPNIAASTLSSKKSGRIALLIEPDSKNHASDEICMSYIAGALKKAKEMRLDIITLFPSMVEDMNAAELTSYLKSQNVKGLVIYSMTSDDKTLLKLVKSKDFKCVIIDSPFCNENTSSVWINNALAQEDVILKSMENMICNSILYIAGDEKAFVTKERIKGANSIAKRYKARITICNGNYSELKAREITLSKGNDYDLIACGSDMMAIGAMKALIDMDVFHPVCGFDGIRLMGYAGKQMNTVKQDFEMKSAVAVEELGRLMNGGKGQNIIVPYELVRMEYEDIIC